MRTRALSAWFLALLLVCLVGTEAKAASTLNFPRLSTTSGELTGMAIVNPGKADAVVWLTAYDELGRALSGKDVTNPAEVRVPAGRQVAKLSTEVFGAGLESGKVAWCQGLSEAEGLTGFFLVMNPSVTMMDGAELPVAGSKVIFNYVRIDGDYTTEINIVNPGSAAANVQVQLMGVGTTPVIKGVQIPGRGVLRMEPGTFFGVTEVVAGAYVVADSDEEVAGFELVRSAVGDAVGLNARSSAERLRSLYFLQMAVLGQVRTELGVINYSAEPAIVTVTAYKGDGTLYDSADLRNNPVTRALVGGGSFREELAGMFGFRGEKGLEGWLTVRSTSESVNGYVVYGVAGTGAATAVTSAAEGRKRALFSHLVTASGYYTTLNLLNPGTVPANVRVMAMNAAGEVLGSYDGVVQPGQRVRRNVGTAEMISKAGGQVGGYLWVKSDLPLYMSTLIGSEGAWANIPGQEAPETYNPDGALGVLKLTPPIAIVPPGTSQRYSVEGGSGGVVWRVNGATGGTAGTGTITSGGVYTAPKTLPARQVMTITAEAEARTAGATADVLAKNTFITELKVVQSVVYFESLAKIYAAELVALGAAEGRGGEEAEAAGGTNSQIFEVSPTAPKNALANFDGENIVKILSYKAVNGTESLLLLGRTGGRVIRLDPVTKQYRDVVTGLNSPTAMVQDPVSGELLVAEVDRITTVGREVLEREVEEKAAPGMVEGAGGRMRGLGLAFSAAGASGVAVDKCTGRVYLSVGAEGAILEYDPVRKTLRTVVTGLQNPGQLLGLYRQGVTCPDSFHMLVAERGAGRVTLVVPGTGVVVRWVESAGITDLAFIPVGNPFTSKEGVLVTDYTLELKGNVYLVPMKELYDSRPANPAQQSLVPVRADLEVRQTHAPGVVFAGGEVTFTITVRSLGPSGASGVTLVDKLPREGVLVSATPSQGRCTESGGGLRCDLGRVEAQGMVEVVVVVRTKYIPTAAVQRLTNTAVAASSDDDPNPVNDFSAEEVLVYPTQAVGFRVSVQPGATVAGSGVDVVVTALDERGSVAASYMGEVRLSSSDGTATLPGVYRFVSGDLGVHVFSGVVLKRAGNQAVTATDTSRTSVTGSGAVVVTGARASAFQFVSAPVVVTAGVPFDVVVQAQDPYGNVDLAFMGVVHFTSTDPAAVLPMNHAFQAGDEGVHWFQVTQQTAGSQTVTLTATGAEAPKAEEGVIPEALKVVTGTLGTMVQPAAAAVLEVTGISNPITVGTASNATVRARDAYGNTATRYRGTVRFTTTGSGTVPANYTFTASDEGVHTFAGGVTLTTSGLQTVTATDTVTGTITGKQTVAVNPGAAATLQVTGIANPITAGLPSNARVTARDIYNNIATGYTGTVRFTKTGSGTVPANYNFVAGDAGSHLFSSGVILTTAGAQTVTAADTLTPSITGSQTVTVNPAAAASLAVTGIVNPVSPGSASDTTVTAYDAYGNVATGYRGSVTLSSTDPKACLPGSAVHTFTAGDNGSYLFGPLTLVTGPSQTVRAADGTLTGNFIAALGADPGPSVATAAGGPGPIPAGLKVTCTDGPGSFTPVACPVLRWKGYTYWAFSYIDNRFSLDIVAYDCKNNLVTDFGEQTGARYLWQITVDSVKQTVTFWGQDGASVTMSWASLNIP